MGHFFYLANHENQTLWETGKYLALHNQDAPLEYLLANPDALYIALEDTFEKWEPEKLADLVKKSVLSQALLIPVTLKFSTMQRTEFTN